MRPFLWGICIILSASLFDSQFYYDTNTFSSQVLAGSEAQETTAEKKPVWEIFEMIDLKKQRAERNRPYLRFLDRSSLSMGVYYLPKEGKDGQEPHKLDEVYYISSGEGILQVEDDDIPVKPGSVIFVEANAAHHFHSIKADLTVLVFFSTAPAGNEKE